MFNEANILLVHFLGSFSGPYLSFLSEVMGISHLTDTQRHNEVSRRIRQISNTSGFTTTDSFRWYFQLVRVPGPGGAGPQAGVSKVCPFFLPLLNWIDSYYEE